MERKPRLETPLLGYAAEWLTRLVLRVPRLVVAVAAAAAAVALLLTVLGLNFRTSRLDLLNPQSEYNQRWLEYIDEFGDDDDVVLVVEGADPTVVVPVLDELAAHVQRDQRLFCNVLCKIDCQRLHAKGLHWVEANQLVALEQFLERFEPVTTGDWSQLNLGRQTVAALNALGTGGGEVVQASYQPQQLEQAAAAIGHLTAALSPQQGYQSPWGPLCGSLFERQRQVSPYALSRDGSLGFILLHLVERDNGFAKGTEGIARLRQIVPSVQARHEHVQIGLTGLPVMENDEMHISQQDMIQASLLSLLGVAALFVAGFGSVRHPMLAVAALLLALAWSFGYVTLCVGHLNILSMAFGVILIGLGIDFGIHYLARYLQILPTMQDNREALARASRTISPGILTGGVTTSIAFFTAALTKFTGVAELGIVAGGGILLCIVAALIVLPAMIYLADQHRDRQRPSAMLLIDHWVRPAGFVPRLSLLVSMVVTLLLAVGAARLRYDHNLLNLQPEGLASVDWERRILNDSDQSVWYALSLCDTRQQLDQRREAFERLATVVRTEDIFTRTMFPQPDDRKTQHIARIAERLARLPDQTALIPVVAPAELEHQLRVALRQLDVAGGPAAALRAPLETILELLRRTSPTECYTRLSQYQQRSAADLLAQLHTIRRAADPQPPRLTDLPESLRARFVSGGGRYLLKVYARDNIWDIDRLAQFVSDVESVDPIATGKPLQTYYASRQMQQSYIHAAVFALIAVLIVLQLDFRYLRLALLAMTPMVLGMVQLFGVLGWLDIPLNPANMIVLPLILGIGIDDGVHVVHDFRQQTGRYHLSSSTATAVLLTSLTTMVGFGSLMLAHHEGLRSLGRVLTIGVCCCLFTSLVMLPALLTWITRHRQDEDVGHVSNVPA